MNHRHDITVSVIIIFRNAADFLDEAIQSVNDQRYQDWELILVDDGSVDQSLKLATDWKNRNDRIRVIAHPDLRNHGMSASRNLGIRSAAGRYIAFLDADDIWLPNKLERQVQLLVENQSAKMVISPSLEWHSWRAEASEGDKIREVGPRNNCVVPAPQLLDLYFKQELQSPGIGSILLERSLATEVGLFEEVFTGMFEDQVFVTKCFLNAPVYVDTVVTDWYRQHANSFCHQSIKSGVYQPDRQSDSETSLILWQADYLRNNKQTTSQIMAQFEQYRARYFNRLEPDIRPRHSGFRHFVTRVGLWCRSRLGELLGRK